MTQQAAQAHRGFFPLVAGREVSAERAGGLAFLSARHLHLRQGGGQWIVALGNLDVQQGGSAIMAARSAQVRSGFVGVLAAARAELHPGVTVLLRATAATAVALGAGLLCGVLLGRSWTKTAAAGIAAAGTDADLPPRGPVPVM